jgi:hypothetical protein
MHSTILRLFTMLSGMFRLTQVHHDVCESRGVGCANPNIARPEPRFAYGEFSLARGRAAVVLIQLR